MLMRTQLFISRHHLNSRTDILNTLTINLLKSDFTDKTIQAHPTIRFGVTIGR